jgi:hypothetical protein
MAADEAEVILRAVHVHGCGVRILNRPGVSP